MAASRRVPATTARSSSTNIRRSCWPASSSTRRPTRTSPASACRAPPTFERSVRSNFKDRTVAVNVRGELNGGGKLNDDVKNWGGRASISYIDRITPELGFAVGLAYLNSPSSNRHTKGYNYETFCCGSGADGFRPGRRAGRDIPDRPGSLRLFAQQQASRRDRHPRMGAERSRPHDPRPLLFALQAARDDARRAMVLERLGRRRRPSPTSSRKTVAATELAVTGTANGVAPQLRNDYNKRDDWLFSAGLNNEFKISDQLSLLTDLSYSRNKRDGEVVGNLRRLRLLRHVRADAERQSRVRFDQLGHRRQRLPAISARPGLCRCQPGFAGRSRALGRLGP